MSKHHYREYIIDPKAPERNEGHHSDKVQNELRIYMYVYTNFMLLYTIYVIVNKVFLLNFSVYKNKN